MAARMRRRPIRTMALAACVAGLVVASAHGAVAPPTSHVSASLSDASTPSRTRLTIKLNGQPLYDNRVRSQFCASACAVTALSPGASPLKVLNMEPDGEPDVVLGLYTGGAHCCFIDQVFSLDPGTMTYTKIEHDFLDAGARIVRLDTHYEFLSADANISEAGFTDYADSGAPIQIWRLIDRRFMRVTQQYPKLIAADAAVWMKAFGHHIANGVGFIAAWAADEDLLGDSERVATTLNHLARTHQLRSALGLPHHSATAFVAELQKVLRRLGYT
jgi:hypothetical protein